MPSKNIDVLYQKLYGNAEGRKVIEDILKHCGYGNNPYTENSQRMTDFRCGKLDVALFIMKKVKGGSTNDRSSSSPSS